MSKLVAFFASVALVCAPALADTTAPASPAALAPSAVVGAPSTYDNQTITVAGTVKGVSTQQMRRGTMIKFQLCDAQCVNVMEFGDTAAPAEGQTQTITGRFRANISRGRMQATNVILVMPAGGWKGRH
jgi:cytochrome c-type biogenesis protein CcmE